MIASALNERDTQESARALDDDASREIRVYLVFGRANCGKSTYAAERFGEDVYEYLDVFQFQNPSAYRCIPDSKLHTMLSYTLLEYVLGNTLMSAGAAIASGQIDSANVVVEGTYAKAVRRAQILQTVRNVENSMARYGVMIRKIALYLDCSPETAKSYGVSKNLYDSFTGLIDVPDESEGFDEVECIETSRHVLSDDAIKLVRDRNEIDRVTRDDLLGYGRLLKFGAFSQN